MNVAVMSTRQWNISARVSGEVLTAAAHGSGCHFMLLGAPAGYTAPEIEGWLNDLIGVARETSREDTRPRPIPALLHHALTALLFSHSEVWSRAGGSSCCSLACVQAGDEVGFGCVGEIEPEVTIDGRRADVEWVRVRDEAGSDARALGVHARHRVSVSLSWPADRGESDSARITVVAEWPGDSAGVPEAPAAPPETTPAEATGPKPAPSTLAEFPVEEGAAGEAPAAEPVVATASVSGADSVGPAMEGEVPGDGADAPPTEAASPGQGEWDAAGEPDAFAVASGDEEKPERRRSVFRAWLDRVWPWRRGHARAALAEPAAVGAEAEPPGAEPEPAAANGETLSAGPLADLIPPTPESPELTALASDWRSLPSLSSAPVGHTLLLTPLDSPESEVEPNLRDLGEPAAVLPVAAAGPAEPVTALHPHRVTVTVASPSLETPLPPVAGATTIELEDAKLPEAAASPATPPAVPAIEPTSSAVDAAPVPPELVIEHVPFPESRIMVTPEAPPETGAPPTVPPAAAAEIEQLPAAEPEPADAPRTPLRPAWPSALELEGGRPLWKRTWFLIALVFALFAGGWLVGGLQENHPGVATRRNPFMAALRSLGIAGARFEVMVNSRPQGAWIAADGRDLARRTPASVELSPGAHQITLSFSDLGSATYETRGQSGDQLVLDAPLWGSLAVHGTDAALPIGVALDGRSVGFVPLVVDSVMPGPHELRFSGPGLASWGQTVRVRVGETAEILARPMTSPATGVIEVRASLTGERGTESLGGAIVRVDGEKRGVTPLTLELPRGPHSIRVEYHGEEAPIQVIDLPGGNQRFASFELGVDLDHPMLRALAAPARMPVDQPSVISAGLEGVIASEVREMWLHTRSPEGQWRRYQMVMLKAPAGVVGVAIFPLAMFDEYGLTRYYLSASIQTGDEFFTEMLTAQLVAPAPATKR